MLDGRHTCPQPIWLFLALLIYSFTFWNGWISNNARLPCGIISRDCFWAIKAQASNILWLL